MPYLGKSPEFGVRERFYYTQTSAGATSISGFDDNGTSLRFTDGNYVDVYLNGVLLVDDGDVGDACDCEGENNFPLHSSISKLLLVFYFRNEDLLNSIAERNKINLFLLNHHQQELPLHNKLRLFF